MKLQKSLSQNVRLSTPLFWSEESRKKWIFPEQLEEKVAMIREDNVTIATLNGSFDLLHAGHLQIIFEASQQADILIVALNSDASIQAYKDPFRPIISLEHRLEMMTALAFVDYVTWFEETTPLAVLEKIRPDVHVNGVEYGRECVESALVKKHGGRLHLVEIIEGLSTSAIVSKIQHLESRTK